MEYLQISVTGIIQGVGFRPFIYRKACELGLKGSVCNTNLGVTINLSGEPEKLDQFINAVKGEAPPAAVIDSITVQRISPFENDRFEISKSTVSGDREVLISPDLGTCEECVKELFDPADRRYRYPFINCTNCGPRFTIIENTPYDRRSTSMSSFTMCDQCREEYEDPMNRRFHAQPNACPRCGPRLLLVNREGEKLPGEPVDVVSEMLKRGEIVAVKGLGGFHLACDATSDEAVRELRRRKNRYGKPLAVMIRDSARARDYCEISPMEHSLMSSP
ncbi:MAG: carbamoyltransferase HypF, partial [Actinobacteria bacterium]|nr:carbamoyltransferase HypF [Actinomycetota bacterium]